MKEHYTTYSQAVKLKELGFDEPCEFYYNPHQEIRRTKTNLLSPQITNNRFLEEIAKGMATAPRLDQAQAWLREVKEIHVEPHFQYGTIFKVVIQSETKYLYKTLDKGYDTYELALSAGIDAALELLTDNTK